MLGVSLFFSVFGNLRDLLSFPTRRSSDLAALPGLCLGSGSVSPDCQTNAAMARICSSFSRKLDRKSTRLNSSHRCISYAVFCLKKKSSTYIYNQHPSLEVNTYHCCHCDIY